MSDHREAIAEWLHAQLCVGMTTASAEPCASCYSDADALLGSDVLAQIRAEARAEAWDEGYYAGELMARLWGHTDHWEDEPANPYRAGGSV